VKGVNINLKLYKIWFLGNLKLSAVFNCFVFSGVKSGRFASVLLVLLTNNLHNTQKCI
jgi:hypothetical protein